MDEEFEPSQIDSHLAFGGLIGTVSLNDEDWHHLVENGFVTVNHHHESGGDAIIELTIKHKS